MDACYLPNGTRVDTEGVVDVILAREEWPQSYLDIETGTLVYIASPKALADWIGKIESSQRYFCVERLVDEDRNAIAEGFVRDILGTMASKVEVDGTRVALTSGGWRAMETHLRDETDGWIHAWDQYVADEAWDFAHEWLTGNPHVAITTKFEGCGNCALCELMRQGEGGDMVKLMQAFATENTMHNVQMQLAPTPAPIARTPKARATKKSRAVSDKSKGVVQLKIELSASKPLIWRRILVPEEYTFWDLHFAIQDSMGWFDCHLHQFFDRSPYTGRTNELTCIRMPWETEEESEQYLDEHETPIMQFLKKEKDAVWYEYDFGDGWMHKITLEKVLPRTADMKLPSIVAGKNRCPYEDSGALWGFYEKMEILKNKKHPEHHEILEWVADIEGYDVDEVDDHILAELSDITRFDMSEIEWNDPQEVLDEYMHRK